MYLGSQKEMVVGTTSVILTRASWTVCKIPTLLCFERSMHSPLSPVHAALVQSTLCILYSSVACIIIFYLRFKDLPTLTDSSISVILLSSVLAQGQISQAKTNILRQKSSLMGPWKLDKVICISLIGSKLENSKSIGEKTRPRDFYFYILVYITGTGNGSESFNFTREFNRVHGP